MRTTIALLLLATPLIADDTDVQHVKLDIAIDPVAGTVGGTSTMTVHSTIAGLNTFSFDLHSSFAVSGATCNGAPAPFTRQGDQVRVTLNRPYNQGESFTVALAYAGSPPNLGFSSFTFRTHGSSRQPIISSLSEPWYAYTWWPCKETLTDKFTLEMWVTVPSNLIVASNGLLQGTDTLSGNRTRYRWSHTYPIITYGVSVAISDYRTRTDTYTYQGANMPVQFYIYPESWSSSIGGMNLMLPMIETFSSIFGQYPFDREKYGIAMFSWGGGMEHQTITSQSSVSEWLSSHELAHSWWGNMITCATWHDIWLNEGFATLGEALYREFKPGGSIAGYHSQMSSRRPSNRSGTVYVYNPSSVGVIFNSNNVYRKGAWVLHQLRHIVGDTTFFQILANWRAAKAYQSGTTAEFTGVVSATAGEDMGWFIDQCVMNPGAPAYEWGWRHEVVRGRDYLFLHIEQTQDALGWGLFRFPIDIRVRTSAGTNTYVVRNDNWRDEYVLALPGAPTSVELDPDEWILRESSRNVSYAPSLTVAPTTLSWRGGTANLTLAAGSELAGRPYLIFGSLTDIQPGIALPGEKILPLTYDGFTDLTLVYANSPAFPGFRGNLDAAGRASAQMVLPPLDPSAIGVQAHFTFATLDEPYYTSIPVTVTVGP